MSTQPGRCRFGGCEDPEAGSITIRRPAFDVIGQVEELTVPVCAHHEKLLGALPKAPGAYSIGRSPLDVEAKARQVHQEWKAAHPQIGDVRQ